MSREVHGTGDGDGETTSLEGSGVSGRREVQAAHDSRMNALTRATPSPFGDE